MEELFHENLLPNAYGSDQQGGPVLICSWTIFSVLSYILYFFYIGLYLKLLYKVFFREDPGSYATVTQQ